ncbi:hypothetical protein COO60DRAFT_1473580 [Scenedesmus sp. NREL 46B-D3]|nr:hypothetical protein COO60DRAFT_1473580 [Scenedesmus sp. NREL 46B-D3]
MAARLALMIAQDGMMAAARQQQQQQQGSEADTGAALGRSSADVGRVSRISRMSTSSNGSTRWSHTLATSSMRSSNSLGTTSWQSSSCSRRQGRPGTYSTTAALGPTGPGGCVHQQAATALGFLCFANIPPPPPSPWVEAHKGLDIDWYVAVMARLHLNTFKVDATFPIDWSQGHAAAAAMLGGDAASAGSALYLLGSLFNHSCEPNVHVTFPSNSTAELDARQEYLAFAYGFRCRCFRCHEELEEQAKRMPSQLP